jgi:cytosine permease
LGTLGVLAGALTYVVGFFATAGAAGVDFGTSSRNAKDVHMGGLVGVAAAIGLTACAGAIIVAGAYGDPNIAAGVKGVNEPLQVTQLMGAIAGADLARILWFLLALAAFPAACFSSFIAANSFKTTLPKVNPFISVGIGAAVSIALGITGWAGQAIIVFKIIGASFGPICGAMLVEYIMNKGQWVGPRAGFNPAGWLSWLLGFIVGILDVVGICPLPAAPMLAFIVGAVVYFVAAKMGLESKRLNAAAS